MEGLETKKNTPQELPKEPTGLKLFNTSYTTADYAIIFIDFLLKKKKYVNYVVKLLMKEIMLILIMLMVKLLMKLFLLIFYLICL